MRVCVFIHVNICLTSTRDRPDIGTVNLGGVLARSDHRQQMESPTAIGTRVANNVTPAVRVRVRVQSGPPEGHSLVPSFIMSTVGSTFSLDHPLSIVPI